jgi:thiosulfate dehydrogenase (quinone) large subunit
MSLREFVAEANRRSVPGGLALGVTRIIIGLLWFEQLLWKLPPDFGRESPGGGLWFWMNQAAEHPTLDIVRVLLETVVLPNFYLFGWLVWLLELAIAVSLLLGLLTRAGALLGVLQSLNLLVLLAAVPHEWYWTYLMLALLSAIFFFTRAGRSLGLDQWLAPRLESRDREGGRLASIAAWLT